jgi:F-type H+-transporting ATPase subunit epsilon
MPGSMRVEVVSPDGIVWEGEAVGVGVVTPEGQRGILYNHWPMIAPLVPSATEIITEDGRREVIAVEGGFISVFQNHISVLSDSAVLAADISLHEAREELAEMELRRQRGELLDDELRTYNLLVAQVRAGIRHARLMGEEP